MLKDMVSIYVRCKVRQIKLTTLPSNTREMILIIFEIAAFERHQADYGGLLGFRGYFVRVEGLGGELCGLFCRGAFACCWGVGAGFRGGGDGDELGFG